ncbi:DNA methylase [Pseudomonas eucalypticola]|uniref:DNA methylase n=1 Tax=Pseudomonas eucalypticola TaxID=2599595 RepID=A0A7D5HN68_9PSED|nr:DNA methylase [Pseudomonas eucalypticola]QKZ04188.1 DNA methylase [Pseudomonas eucalypticola]
MIAVTAADLGIDINEPGGNGLFKWLLASFLIGKRIRTSVAVKAFHRLVDQEEVGTPEQLARCSHAQVVRWLGEAGYARYDESTARRLRVLGKRVSEELQPQLRALCTGVHRVADFERWLLSFEGVGPKTVEIFMREAAGTLNDASADLLMRS